MHLRAAIQGVNHMKPNNNTPTMDILHHNFTISEEEMQALFLRLEEDYRKSFHIRELLYNLHRVESEDKANRLKDCGRYITKYNSIFGSALLMNKCHIRFCPICEKQNAMQRFIMLANLLTHKNIDGTLFHYIFTCKNCEADSLRETIQGISAGVRMFMRHYGIKDYTRRIEVTYNHKRNDYHPHAHCIVLVEKGSLFMKDLPQEEFITRLRELRMYWRDCCVKNNIAVGNLDYQELYARPLINKAELIECVKYSVKPISITEESLQVIHKALKGLKLFNGSGIFRQISTVKQKEVEMHKTIIDNSTEYETFARTPAGYKIIKYNNTEELQKMKDNLSL